MKTKIFHIPIFLLVADFLLSIPQVESHLSIINSLRLAFIPLLVLVLIELLRKVDGKRIKFAMSMSWPLLLLMMFFLFQIVAIPPAALPIHLSGCGKFVSWSLLYVCALLSLNSQTAQKVRNILLLTLLFVFLATILQYPILIQHSSESLSSIIASYGRQNKDIFGLFASANEDANSLVTLFPLALFFIRKKSGIKRLILNAIILIYVPIVLFFNGTRTALFITFPIVIFLFFFSLSLKTLIRTVPFILSFIFIYKMYVVKFAESSFSSESEGGGTWGFRVERVWIPASTYTFENSPIWGFGSRGWEYVCTVNQIMRGTGEESAFEVIPSHNVYVWAYVSWGIIGFLIYLAFLMILIKESFKLSIFTKDIEVSTLGKTLFASVVAYCIWAFISNAYLEVGWDILWILGIIIASLKITASLSRNRLHLLSTQGNS